MIFGQALNICHQFPNHFTEIGSVKLFYAMVICFLTLQIIKRVLGLLLNTKGVKSYVWGVSMGCCNNVMAHIDPRIVCCSDVTVISTPESFAATM